MARKPAVNPLTTWKCDKCGEKTVTADNGYVIWDGTVEKERDFRIIHKAVCDDRRFTSSLPLSDFLGPLGVAKLTSFLSLGIFINQTWSEERLQANSAIRIADMDQFMDFFRRVQLPYYEEARPILRAPSEEVAEMLCDSSEVAPYIPHNLKSLIERYG